MEDEKILFLLINKPEQGLFHLNEKYLKLINTIVGRILLNHKEDIDECVADTFIKIWKNAKNISMQNNTIKGYVSITARSTAIDRYRKLKKDKATQGIEDYIPSDEDIELCYEENSTITVIENIINEMPPPDDEIFLRRFFLFESIKDIAHKLNMGEKAIESRLFRGRKKLKEMLIERGIY